tara:strand:- start:4445 stop:4678 length:234 start_codon:yes stop_codon:yes gene_type:complete
MQIVRQIMPRGMPLVVDAQLEDNKVIPDTVTIYPITPQGFIGEALPFEGELGGMVAGLIHKKHPDLEELSDDPYNDS